MVKSICVISHDATYGNGAALAEGFKKLVNTVTVFRNKDIKGMYSQTDCIIGTITPLCDHYIIIGAISLRNFPPRLWDKGVTIILTDSTYLKDPKTYNNIIAKYKWNVFAMPDLAPLNGTKNMYYQPFIMPDVSLKKTELICHSPFHVSKLPHKGTYFIKAVCTKNDLPLTIIMNKTWEEAIKIKRRYWICIDRLADYTCGVGKTGLEAMLLDCAVISGTKPEGENLPPIVWTSKETFEKDLLKLVHDKEYRIKVIKRQRKWADKNLDPKVVAQKIIDRI